MGKKINNITRKFLIGMMTFMMIVPSVPVTVNAEGSGTSADATLSATETTNQDAAETSTPSPDVNSSGTKNTEGTILNKDGTNVVEIDSTASPEATVTPTPSSSPSATPEVDKNQSTDNPTYETEKDVLNYVGGDKDKAKLYEFWQERSTYDIKQDEPEFYLSVGGMGTVKVVREDGSYTTYRYDHTAPVDYDKNNKELPEKKFKENEIPDYVHAYSTRRKDVTEEYLKHPEYKISGKEQEKVHIVITPDADEKIRNVAENVITTTIRNSSYKSMVSENDDDSKKSSYEFDYYFTSGTSDTLNVLFTDVNHQIQPDTPSENPVSSFNRKSLKKDEKGSEDTKETSAIKTQKFTLSNKSVAATKTGSKSVKLKTAMASGATSGEGTVWLHIKSYNLLLNNYDGNDRFANSWWITPSDVNGAPEFAALLKEYEDKNGNFYLQCNSGATPAPRVNRPYKFTWSLSVDNVTGRRTVTVHVCSDEIRWNTQYGTMYDNGKPVIEATDYLQSLGNSFYLDPIPPEEYKLTVNVEKTVSTEDMRYLNTIGSSLAGASFAVYGKDGTPGKGRYYGNITTDANGHASGTWSNIKFNTTQVYIEQTAAPTGLSKEGPWTLDVSINGTTGTVKLIDDKETPIKTTAKVRKVDSKTGQEVDGAVFSMKNLDVYWDSDDPNTGHVENHRTYEIKGNQTLDNVWAGTYEIKEIQAPEGYYLNTATKTLKVENNRTNIFVFDDQPIDVEVLKKSKGSGDPISGVTLELRDADGSHLPLEQWVTDGNPHKLGTGTLLNGWSGKLKHGHHYDIHEIAVPNGIELDTDTIIDVNIPDIAPANNQPLTYTFYNTEMNYQVNKIDAQTGKRLGGATLQLLENGKILESWTSSADSDHRLSNKNLRIGHTYTIHEASGVDGYYLPSKDVSFVAGNSGGQINLLSVIEYPIRYQAIKVDAGTGEYLKGVKLSLADKADPGNTLLTWTTTTEPYVLSDAKDSSGKHILKIGHSYIIRESSTIPGYYKNNHPVEFTVARNAGEDEKNTITLKVENHPITAYAGKYDGITSTPITGAKMAIKENGKTVFSFTSGTEADTKNPFAKEGLTKIWNTDLDTNLLEAGKTYQLTETEQPKGYFKLAESDNVSFTVPETWEEALKKYSSTDGVIKVTAYDYPIKIALKKVDEKGKYVSGAHLTLTGDNFSEQWTSSQKDYTIASVNYLGADTYNENLKAGGTYTLHEDVAARGYYYSNNISFKIPESVTGNDLKRIKRGDPVPVAIVDITSGKVTNSHVNTVSMTDQKIDWRIRKVDDKGRLLTIKNDEVFEFKIYKLAANDQEDASASPIVTLTTDDPGYIKNGYWKIDSDRLEADQTYRVKETFTPKGMMPSSHDYTVAIPRYRYTQNANIRLDRDGSTSYWYGSGGQNNFGSVKCIGTQITNAPFHLYFKKTDENGKTLYNYIDNASQKKKPFTFQLYQTGLRNMPDQLIATFDTNNSEYRNSGRLDISKYMYWGQTYKIHEINEMVNTNQEKDAYPYGYYRESDKPITLTVNDQSVESTVNWGPMKNAIIKARFRKENYRGEPVVWTDSSGRHGRPNEYVFRITDITNGGNVKVKEFDLNEADRNGYVSIGNVLQEGHKYRIDEIAWPVEVRGNESITFTVPTHYNGDKSVPNTTKGTAHFNGNGVYVDANGNPVRNTWLEFSVNPYDSNEKARSHTDGNGLLIKNSHYPNADIGSYYFDSTGAMVRNTWVGASPTYHYGSDGRMDYKQ